MINPIPGWSWDLVGGTIYLSPPEGIEAGGIHYTERVRPLLGAEALAAALPVPPDYAITGMSRPEDVITREGEHGSLVTVTGVQAGQDIVRTVGLVYGDDFQSVIVGTARRPAMVAPIAARVRTLVLEDQHFLGIRRRRFRYQAPSRWRATFVAPFHVHHDSHDGATIVVHPAVPNSLDADYLDAAVRAMIADEGLDVVEASGPDRAPAPRGLDGVSYLIQGTGRSLTATFLRDARYTYPIVLTTPDEIAGPASATFSAMVRSVEPIPASRIGCPLMVRATGAFTHWTE